MSNENSAGRPVSICRLDTAGERPRIEAALDAIFFEASSVKSFASEEGRRAFRERWLGRYLSHYPRLTYVAFGSGGAPLGYIVGAHDDPAANPLFADIGYWPLIADLIRRYPAHLHINLAPEARGHGIGASLIAAFVADVAAAAGVRGVHLVTGQASRNRSFYARCGFADVRAFAWHGTPIVMLAKAI